MRLEDLLELKHDPNKPIAEIIRETAEFYGIEIDNNPPHEQTPLPDYILSDTLIVGYPDKNMQDEIYRWVLNDIGLGTVKDFGCGRGDFGQALSNEQWPNDDDRYIGIDQLQTMTDAGRQKYGDRFNFITSDWMFVDTITDYTVCIGSLNDYRDDAQTHFWQTLWHAVNTTNRHVIFVFNTDPEDGFSHYPLNSDFFNMLSGYPISIDCSRYEGICKLIVYCQKFQ